MLLSYAVRFPLLACLFAEPSHIALAVYWCCLQMATGHEGAFA